MFSVILVLLLITFIHFTNNILTQQSIGIQKSIRVKTISFENILLNKKQFNISNNRDLLVLLHIQKTGGTTFEKHLVQNLNVKPSCFCSDEKRRCSCFRDGIENVMKNNTTIVISSAIENTWLLSRFSTGWICGLHADWTQLINCFDQNTHKQLYFLTFLRNPIYRFISEFRHVQRGATWKNSRKHCENYDTQYCYRPKLNWSNVSLEEFLNCPFNMAVNRQTRMLANHNLIKCSTNTTNEEELLSAKENLKNMAFFGLCDEQIKSQYIFEKTFQLTFNSSFKQSDDSKAKLFADKLSKDTIERIAKVNHLDIQLFEYAKELFEKRIKQLQK